MPSIEDRKRGALLGLAIGDALGAAVEFKAPGTFEPVTGYRNGGPHKLLAGEWTDDTSMALALADSLTAIGWNPEDQVKRYVSWYVKGHYSVNGRCFDIGGATRRALDGYRETKTNSPSCGENDCGNGSLMRLAPVPIYYAYLYGKDEGMRSLIKAGAASSNTTHGHEKCLWACGYLSLVLAGLINGVTRSGILATAQTYLEERAPREICSVANSYLNGTLRSIKPKGTGYVVDCLEAALWAFHDAPDFKTAVLKAVNLGDDADTTGAVCGQLAGAYWGMEGIPADLLDGLAKKDYILGFANRLIR